MGERPLARLRAGGDRLTYRATHCTFVLVVLQCRQSLRREDAYGPQTFRVTRDIVAVWPFLKGLAHVIQRSCVWWQLRQFCSR